VKELRAKIEGWYDSLPDTDDYRFARLAYRQVLNEIDKMIPENLTGRRVMYGSKMGTVRQLWSSDSPTYRIELDSGQIMFITRGSFHLLP
jgi:hypothetical protein